MSARGTQQQQPPAGDGGQPPAGGGQPPAGGGSISRDDVQNMIQEALRGVQAPAPSGGAGAGNGGGRPRSQTQQTDDMAAQVRAEVERIREGEKAAEHRSAVDNRLKELEEAAKKIPQAAPREFRPITQKLWGDR
jgi:hypothetical protein